MIVNFADDFAVLGTSDGTVMLEAVEANIAPSATSDQRKEDPMRPVSR